MLTRYCAKKLQDHEQVVINCEDNQGFVVHSIWLTNTHASNTTYTIRHVPKGQTSGSDFDLASGVEITTNQNVIYDSSTKIYLQPGDKLTAFAGNSERVSMFVYGNISNA